MGDITIRKLDDDVIQGLAIRAAKNGVSREEESRRILTAAIRQPSPSDIWEKMAQLRERTRGRPQTDSVEIIREMRDSR